MSEENVFNPGALVQLKSGGPVMTYEGESAYTGEALCSWFADGKRHQEAFAFAILEPAPKPRK